MTADHLHVNLFFHELRQKGYSASQMNIFLVALRGFYEEIKLAGKCVPSDLFTNINTACNRSSRIPTPALTNDEAFLLLSMPNRNTAKGRRDYAILSLILGAGLRASEVKDLRSPYLAEIDGVPVIFLRDTKSHKYRHHSIAPWVLEALQAHDIKSYEPFPISYVAIYKVFKRYCRQAGLSDIYSPHSGRVTAINKLLEDGFNMEELRRFSRHSSVQMVEEYNRRRVDITKNPGLYLIYGDKK